MIDNGFEFYFHRRKTFECKTPFPTILPHFCTNHYSSKSLIFSCEMRDSHDGFHIRCLIDQVLSEPWRPKRRQNITVLTTLPQWGVLASVHDNGHYDVDRIFVGLS